MERESKVKELLCTVGVPITSLEWVLDKLRNWDFIISVANHLANKGTITDKQREAVINILTKRFKITLESTILEHSPQYTRIGGDTKTTNRRLVEHDFGKLEQIQLFDLPFESNTTVSLRLYKFNSHNCVIAYNNAWYKIPLPTAITLTNKTTDIIALYKRTAKKGFLKDITILKHVHP